MTVREIAVTWPELLPELERLGIDYCCGGGRTLGEAAGGRAGAVAEDLARFEASPGPGADGDWSAASMTALADHIESTHHAYVRTALTRAERLLGKCVAAHGDDEPRLAELQAVLAAFTEDMHDHMVREERVLFPWLRRLERRTQIDTGPPWSVRRPIDCMVHDHDAAGAALRTMRDLTDGFRVHPGACPTWRAAYALLAELERDTHIHVHKENNVLFPKGVEAEEALKARRS
jgi:regulator of cell morphogenesis and NO signaling